MGHFFPAKWFKCRVEKFFLFLIRTLVCGRKSG
ncbi:MAG: hypothetical protein WKG06_35415 [Segetibacter sp.]